MPIYDATGWLLPTEAEGPLPDILISCRTAFPGSSGLTVSCRLGSGNRG